MNSIIKNILLKKLPISKITFIVFFFLGAFNSMSQTSSSIVFPEFLIGEYLVSSNQSDYYNRFDVSSERVNLFNSTEQLEEHYMLYSVENDSLFVFEMIKGDDIPYDRTTNKDRFLFKVYLTFSDKRYNKIILKVIHPNSFEELLTLKRTER